MGQEEDNAHFPPPGVETIVDGASIVGNAWLWEKVVSVWLQNKLVVVVNDHTSQNNICGKYFVTNHQKKFS